MKKNVQKAIAVLGAAVLATGMVGFLRAFVISPCSLPKITLWITAYLEVAKDTLKEI